MIDAQKLVEEQARQQREAEEATRAVAEAAEIARRPPPKEPVYIKIKL